jgi:methionine--tRNA ligase beta chain
MTNPKRYLITAALPYANGLKHVGHLAGAYLPADTYVRYLRAQKRDVVFVSGSDEHGTAIPIQAMKEGTTPRAIIDKYHEEMKQDFADLNISFDIYHRTSEPIHHETSQEFFTYLNDRGELETKETEQYYDEAAKTFLADRYIKGTCPNCKSDRAYGDQCENCGTSLSPEELINPVSTLSGNAPIKKATTHWYLPLGKHEAFLREWILGQHKDDWRNTVVGQCRSWIEGGLQSRAVTRDLDWGIKVPAPPPPKGGSLAPEEIARTFNYETADPITYGLLKQFVKEHRSNPTEAEIALWEMLRGKHLDGYKFRRQHIIGNYIADFVCLSAKLIIEVDGLIHQLPESKKNDAERTAELNKWGFKVIRFNNDETLNNRSHVAEKILAAVTERKAEVSATQFPPSGGGGAKVLYVWFDAPIGYISATKQWALDNNKDWKPYWQDKDTKLIHFVGKDNIVFHCIIFPVMLKLHGNILPDNVPANEFLNLEGDKMSTSRNWKLEMRDYINDFVKPENGGAQAVDMLRYYLTQIAPETKDSEFMWKGFQDAINSELVSIFANFVNRAFVLMHKLCGGKVPKLHEDVLDEKDRQLISSIESSKNKIEQLLEEYKFRDALFEVIDLARKGNKYMQEKEPWILAKTLAENPGNQKLIDICLHLCLQLTANLAILINPFLPNTAKKMIYLMKVVDKLLDWENAGKIKLLSVGYSLRPPELLFRKIEDAEIATQIEKLKSGMVKSENETQSSKLTADSSQLKDHSPKPVIQFDDFSKIDLRIGTIISAEKVEKADKLLKLEVDLGFEKRTIVSGIALHFNAADIIGKQVTIVANLAPRKMKGIESNGMILLAEDADGKLKFINADEGTANGATVS